MKMSQCGLITSPQIFSGFHISNSYQLVQDRDSESLGMTVYKNVLYFQIR